MMDRARTELVTAYNVQEAGQYIYAIFKMKRNEKVFYYDGWDGFGASAVLRYIAAMLPSRRTFPELCFDRIIFIDCSKWKNRRAVQRAIATELKLDRHVIAVLDKQDDEDDFMGFDESSRDEIHSVAQVIHQTLSATKFMMFFLNGSDEEIDVGLFGIPLFSRYGNNMMLWTFNSSCLTMHEHDHYGIQSYLRYTHVYLRSDFPISDLGGSCFRDLLHQQAATIVDRGPDMHGVDPTMVTECFLYELFLSRNFHIATKFEWLSHASNYWICDAIIKGDRARDICNALHEEISWEFDASLIDEVFEYLIDYYMEPPSLVVKDANVSMGWPYRWISITSRNTEISGLQTIPATTSSFFLAFERFTHSSILQDGLFENSFNLGVLVLCYCAFNFASPPFRKCPNLKFLGLDHCTHRKISEEDNHIEWACLYNLLVLDLRYTNWDEILSKEKMCLMKNIKELNIEGFRSWHYTTHLQGQLPNLERLRIVKPTCRWETSIDVDNSFLDKTSMEMLDFSGNSDMKTVPTSLWKASSLQVLILDGCDGLEDIVALGRLPPSLRFISFDGYGPASQRTPTVELALKHFRPPTIKYKKNISTSRISLEGCTKLENLFLRGLNNLVELDLSGTAIKILDFKTMVVQVPWLKRLYLIGCKHLCAIIFAWGDCWKAELDLELICIDTRDGILCPWPIIDKTKSFHLQAFPQPPATRLDQHIEIAEGSCYVESSLDGELGNLMGESTKSLHLHDVSIDTVIPKAKYKYWRSLRWCVVERCPNLDTIFNSDSFGFYELETFWASSLLKARWIWSKGLRYSSFNYDNDSFKNIQHLHLQSCPRLQFVLPMWVSSFPSLETLHIIRCNDLVHVFILDEKYPEKIITDGIVFPKLMTIHLHELPKMQNICQVKMVAPVLEIIKIRGCWGLRRLPSMASRGQGKKKPTVEIEKDVWDALEWDANHRPDHFEAPVHSRHYKKKLPKVSFLR
uniref:Uncharacterized protein n=1 Tax=Avena sativa TaxID=4498 RepID=A0ACD5TRT8_AVESA